jgi:hypothetical protein
MLKRRYFNCDPSRAETTFSFFLDRINLSAAAGNWNGAREIAKEWSRTVSRQLRIPHRKVWKEFKRDIADHWFGRPEKRVFAPPWRVADVLAYATQFSGRNVRVSSFLENIACRSKSEPLAANEERDWPAKLSSLDANVLIEVFPESSTSNGICFRRFSSAFGEEVFYEAGKGQAMAVFEDEQGKHPTVYANKLASTGYSFRPSQLLHPEIPEIRRKLRLLIATHESSIQSKCAGICRRTGIDGLGLEGYFNPHLAKKLVVVDLDLPFDFVFMNHEAE